MPALVTPCSPLLGAYNGLFAPSTLELQHSPCPVVCEDLCLLKTGYTAVLQNLGPDA